MGAYVLSNSVSKAVGEYVDKLKVLLNCVLKWRAASRAIQSRLGRVFPDSDSAIEDPYIKQL